MNDKPPDIWRLIKTSDTLRFTNQIRKTVPHHHPSGMQTYMKLMVRDEDLVVSLNVGVIRAPDPGAVVIRMAFLTGSDRIYVFTAPKAYDSRDRIDAALKARSHKDPPEVQNVALKLLQDRRPTMRRSDVEVLDPSTVLRDVYWNEFIDGVKVAVVCADGTSHLQPPARSDEHSTSARPSQPPLKTMRDQTEIGPAWPRSKPKANHPLGLNPAHANTVIASNREPRVVAPGGAPWRELAENPDSVRTAVDMHHG